MPDAEVKPGDATATEAKTQDTAPPSHELQLDEESFSAGFTAEDFKHPQYGQKAKTLYQGFQKASEARRKIEKEHAEVLTFLKSNPRVSQAIQEAYAELNGAGGTGTSGKDAPSDSGTPGESPQGRPDVEAATLALYTKLGNGDPFKGKIEYEQHYADEFSKILPRYNGTPMQRIEYALEHIQRARAAVSNTTETVTDTKAGSERTRGTSAAGPRKPATDMTDDEIALAALREAGFSDFRSMLSSLESAKT